MAGPLIAAGVAAAALEFFTLTVLTLTIEAIGLGAILAAGLVQKEKINLKYNHYLKNDFSLFDN